MKLSKKILSLFLAVLMVSTMMTTLVSAHSFTDVTDYSTAIDTLSKIKVILGYNDTTFSPNTKVTRWMMALLVAKLHSGNCTSDDWYKVATGYTFADVEDYQYKTSIKYCADRKFIIGLDNLTFNPGGEITLQDAVTIVVRALGYHTTELDKGYPKSYTDKGEELGLFKGLTGIDFKATLTRGQTAQLLYNALYLPRTEGGKEAASFASNAFTYLNPQTGKTETYYANDVATYVLSATVDYSIDNVSKPGSESLTFRKLNSDGTLGESKVLPVSVFEGGKTSSDYNAYVGFSFKMAFDKDGKLLLIKANAPKEITAGLTVNTEAGTISLGTDTYKLVSKLTYDVFDTDAIPEAKEMIVYGINDVYTNPKSAYYTANKLLDTAKIDGTTTAYTITAFDDNGDGSYDRAIYTPYSIGKLVIGINGEVSLAGGSTGVTFTGDEAKNGDVVVYSYNSQNKIINVMNVIDPAFGALTAVSEDKKTAIIGEKEYKLGTEGLLGAANADVIKTLPSSICEVGYVAVGDAIVFIQDKNEMNNNVYKSNDYTAAFGSVVGVVKEIIVNKGNTWPFFKYVATVDVFTVGGATESVTCGVYTIDGVAKDRIPDDLLEVGDIVKISKNETVTELYNASEDAAMFGDIDICDLTFLNSKPTLVFNAKTVMSFAITDGEMSYTSGAFTVKRDCVPNAAVVLYNGERFAEVKRADSFVGATAVELPAKYAAYILVTGGESSADYAIYIRPYAEKQITVSDFDTYVYVSDPEDYEYEAAGDGTFNYSFAGIDVLTGEEVDLNLNGRTAGQALPTAAGYYRAAIIGDSYELFALTPVTASDENSAVSFTKGVTIKEYLTPTDTESENYGITLEIGEDELALAPKNVEFYKYDVLLGFLPITDTSKITAESIEGATADYFCYKSTTETIAIVIK